MNAHALRTGFRWGLPQAITTSRIILAGWAVFATLSRDHEQAVGLITLGAVTDGLDGPLARKLRSTTEFGALFDYFADYLCYVVAPSLVSFFLLDQPSDVFSMIILGLPLLTGAIRYSRNAPLLRHETFDEVGYPGLGTVFYALFIVALVYLDLEIFLSHVVFTWLVVVTVTGFSLMMISPICYPKLTRLRSISTLILVLLTVMPFACTKILATCTVVLTLSHSIISPFLPNRRPVGLSP